MSYKVRCHALRGWVVEIRQSNLDDNQAIVFCVCRLRKFAPCTGTVGCTYRMAEARRRQSALSPDQERRSHSMKGCE